MSPETCAARSPAKVNLSLRVLGRRSDGYHEVETVFQAIDLWDSIEARESKRLALGCNLPAVPVGSSNLVLQAAAALRTRCDHEVGADLFLRKTIPMGGGLGGGSSDAAATLLLLREFWSIAISDAELTELAAGLGSDVPFFLTGGTAIGSGRGERIEPVPFLGSARILLGLPPFGISTAEVYERFTRRLTPPEDGVRVSGFRTLKLPGGKDFCPGTNDLEAVVLEGWPELAAPLTILREEGADYSLVSGSGSSVFGVFDELSDLPRAAAILRAKLPTWRWVATRAIEGRAHLSPPAGEAPRLGREGG